MGVKVKIAEFHKNSYFPFFSALGRDAKYIRGLRRRGSYPLKAVIY
jgi:hypothetical protein